MWPELKLGVDESDQREAYKRLSVDGCGSAET